MWNLMNIHLIRDIWRKFTLIFISFPKIQFNFFSSFAVFPAKNHDTSFKEYSSIFFIISCVPSIKPELCLLPEDRKQRAGLPKNRV